MVILQQSTFRPLSPHSHRGGSGSEGQKSGENRPSRGGPAAAGYGSKLTHKGEAIRLSPRLSHSSGKSVSVHRALGAELEWVSATAATASNARGNDSSLAQHSATGDGRDLSI